MRKLSIVLFAYNEGANIVPVYNNILKVCQKKGIAEQVELVWVDDGSTDDTWEQIQNVLANSQRMLVKSGRHDRNQGVGAALRTGFSMIEGEYVTPLPSDGEVSVSETLKLFEQVGDADVITSTRDREETLRASGSSFTRKFLTKTQDWIMRVLVLPDMSKFTGVWIVRNEIVRRCNTRLNTGLVRWEILQYAIENDYNMVHSMTPTYASPRISGKSKVANVRTMLRTFWELLRWRYYLWRNFYKSEDTHT